jgi:hypothetical protein
VVLLFPISLVFNEAEAGPEFVFFIVRDFFGSDLVEKGQGAGAYVELQGTSEDRKQYK